MKKRRGWRTDDRQLFLLSLPTVIWFVLFCYLPMFGLIIAFKHYQVAPGKGFLWSLLYNSPWTGLDRILAEFQRQLDLFRGVASR